MNIIKSNSQYQYPGGYSLYQFIERVGRTCYKSEDKITDESAVKFVKNLLGRGHLAMLEHAHVFFETSPSVHTKLITSRMEELPNFDLFRYINISEFDGIAYISGSVAAFYSMFMYVNHSKFSEDSLLKTYLGYLLYPLQRSYPDIFDGFVNLDAWASEEASTELLSREDFIDHVKRLSKEDSDCAFALHLPHTLLLTANRGVTHEIVRHRPVSFAQESTRYVNYEKERYGSSITVTAPPFFDLGTEAYEIWEDACKYAEGAYMKLTKDLHLPAQQARDVLPQSTKADIIVTATESEWQHIINLRYHGTTGAPHPEMEEVMTIAYPQLVEASEGRLK